MQIGFVLTNYNNSILTRNAVESIRLNESGRDAFIVIVDNKSDEINIELLKNIKDDFINIHLIFNDENIGYFKGLNKGIEYLRNYHNDIDHIVIGNNDLIFPKYFINSIYNNLRIFELYAVISPDIITLEGVHQNPHVIAKISKFREVIYDLYYLDYRLSVIITYIAKITRNISDRKDEEQYNIAQTIYQGYGACYILGPLFFKHFDLLWAPTFLMGEELFLSKQLESKKLKIYYEPSILVNHHDHQTICKMPGKKYWEFSRDAHKVYRKYVKIWNRS